MMKIAFLAAALSMAAVASAQDEGSVKIILPAGTQEIAVTEGTVADFFASQSTLDTISVAGQTEYVIPLDPEDAMAITVRVVNRPVNGMMPAVSLRRAMVYAAPGEQLVIDLTSPLASATGSALMDNISAWNVTSDSVMNELRGLGEGATDDDRLSIIQAYADKAVGLVEANADNAFGIYMVSQIPLRSSFREAFGKLDGRAAKTTILAPMYEQMVARIEAETARERAAEKIKVGLPAPGFSLPAPDGSMVALADYRGKWVMLDFWGSWCGWCIKGIPQMKEQWAELKDRNVVFLSVACQDSKEAWLAALEKYELPWVNAWQDPDVPRAEQLPSLYAVSGYPTKMVIDPEGNIALIVVGEDPSFYDQLKALLPAD